MKPTIILLVFLILLAACSTSNTTGGAYNIDKYITQQSTTTFTTTNVHDFAGIGESGIINGVTHEFGKVIFSKSYSDPIVIVGPLSYAGVQAAHPRIKNVDQDGFLIRAEEWYDLDGIHLAESIPYFVIERGRHIIDGKQIVADSWALNDVAQFVTYTNFTQVPVVLSSIATLRGPAPLIQRISAVEKDGFTVRLQQEENKSYGARVEDEQLNYIAIEQGAYTDAVYVGRTPRSFDHSWKSLTWPIVDAKTVLADMQSMYGGDTANLRYNNLKSRSVELFVQEEQSRDSELIHITEVVGYVAIGRDLAPFNSTTDYNMTDESFENCQAPLINGQFQDTDGDGCHAGLDSDCGGIEGVDNSSITCFDNIDNDCDGWVDADDDDMSCIPSTSPTTIRFANNNSGLLQPFGVNYVENENDILDDYLVIASNKPFVEFEIPIRSVEQLDGTYLNMAGRDYIVASAQETPTGATLVLVSGLRSFLDEGETKTYSIEGVDYEVTLVYVSDSGTPQAKLMVNGEVGDAIGNGEFDIYSGGMKITLLSVNNGSVDFKIGEEIIDLYDPTPRTVSFDGSVEIDAENIEDAQVAIDLNNNVIYYRLTADAKLGSTVYIPQGGRLSEQLDEPQGLLGFDLHFQGLSNVSFNVLSFETYGGVNYNLNLQTRSLNDITVPFLSTGPDGFKLGNSTADLIINEGAGWDPNRFNVDVGDYFVLNKDGVHTIVQYLNKNTVENVLTFQDLETGSIMTVAYIPDTTFFGIVPNFILKGTNFAMRIQDNNGSLWIDMNGDGKFQQSKSSFYFPKGYVLEQKGVTWNKKEWVLTNKQSNETIPLEFTKANNELITLSSYQSLKGNEEYNSFQMINDDADDDYSRGRTDYGVLIEHYDPIEGFRELSLRLPSQRVDAVVSITQASIITEVKTVQLREPIGLAK